MNHTICLQVPGHIRYTQIVEDFTRSISRHFFPEARHHYDDLCMVMNEIFTNIVKHSDTKKSREIIEIQMIVNPVELKISVLDHGPGIVVKKQRPPYDHKLVGHREPFRKVLDGTVYLTVNSPRQLCFSFENEALVDDLHQFHGHGFGLSIITKIMDRLTYSALADGKFNWEMTKKIQP